MLLIKFFLIFFFGLSSISTLADDRLDDLALTLMLKKRQEARTYAKERLSFGVIESEPYLTGDQTSEMNKNFLRNVKSREFFYWKKYFLARKGFRAKALLEKGAPYKHIVQNILAYHGLPRELYYLGLIESRYEFRIKSSMGAKGPWQFVKGTGKQYGLIINRYYDERTNLIKSTHAAAEYFKDLYNIFGTWELALSAYNAGEYGVIRRIRQAGTRNFYELSRRKILPPQTRNYVPKILAIAHISKNQDRYGLNIKTPSALLGHYKNTYLVKLKKSHHLKKISQEVGVPITRIRSLNPELRGFHTPALSRGKKYKLRLPLPQEKGSLLAKREKTVTPSLLKTKKKQQKKPSFHIVKKGENLSSIAQKYQMPLGQIMIFNHGIEKNILQPGHRVALQPTAPKLVKVSPSLVSQSQKTSPVLYKVKRGDTLFAISMLFNVRIADIKLRNQLASSSLKVGMNLVIPGVSKKVHIVKKGEALRKIARKHNNSLQTIKRINDLKTLRVQPGQKIVVLE